MSKADTQWTVLPHDPLETLEDGLWRVEGSLPGMPLRRVMTVARRADGGLVVHNAMALDEAGMAALEALGPVAFLVVPGRFHRLDAPRFHHRYPQAKVVAPAGARASVEALLKVDLTYDEVPPDPQVTLRTLHGIGEREGVMQVRTPGGVTLVFNDALFNMPHVPGLKGALLRYVTKSSGGLRVSRLFSMLAVRDKAAFRADLETLAALPDLRRIIVSHHEVLANAPASALAAAAAAL